MRKSDKILLSKLLSDLGRQGGRAGTGQAKTRGNSDYYRKLRAKRKTYPKKI